MSVFRQQTAHCCAAYQNRCVKKRLKLTAIVRLYDRMELICRFASFWSAQTTNEKRLASTKKQNHIHSNHCDIKQMNKIEQCRTKTKYVCHDAIVDVMSLVSLMACARRIDAPALCALRPIALCQRVKHSNHLDANLFCRATFASRPVWHGQRNVTSLCASHTHC